MSAIKTVALTNVSDKEWTAREQLILASAVQKSGDQNWVSVSRAIRPLVDAETGPSEHFSHKNCAQQYSAMLDKAGTHKRRRNTDGNVEVVETAGQQIMRELVDQYLVQLDQTLTQSREEYTTLKKEMEQIEKGEMDSQLPAMWEEMQAELALSKISVGSRRKSSPSTSSLSKQLDQRKKVSPSNSTPSVIVTKPLSSGNASAVRIKQATAYKEEDGVSEGRAGEDRSSAQIQMGVPLSVSEGQVEANFSGQRQLGATISEEERIKLLLGGGGGIGEAVSKGQVASEVSASIDLAGGVVKSDLYGSQEQVRAVVSSMGLSGVDFVAGKNIKLETRSVKIVASTPPVISSKPVTPISLTPTFSKMLLDVTAIKKEPSSSLMPNLMDLGENPTARLLTTPPKEEKVWLPMQTPQPSTHGTHVPAEMHVIIQQPNTAAMLMQENLRKVSIPISRQSSVAMLPTTSIDASLISSTVAGGLPPSSSLTVTAVSNSSGVSPGLSSSAFTPVSKMTSVPIPSAIVRSVSVSRQPVVIPREVANATSLPTGSISAMSRKSPVIMGRASGTVASLPVSDLASLKTQLITIPAPVKPSLAAVTLPTLPLLPKAAPTSSSTTSHVKSTPTTGVLLPSRLLASLSPAIKPQLIPTVSLALATHTITELPPPTTSGLATASSSLTVSNLQAASMQKNVSRVGRNVSILVEGESFVGESVTKESNLTAAKDAVSKITLARAFSVVGTLASASCNVSDITSVTSKSAGLTVATALNSISSQAKPTLSQMSVQTSVPTPVLVPALIPRVSTPGLTILNLAPIPAPVQTSAPMPALVPTISSVSPSIPSPIPVLVSTSSVVQSAPISSSSVHQQQQISLDAGTGAKQSTQSETGEVSKEMAKPEHGVSKDDLMDTEGEEESIDVGVLHESPPLRQADAATKEEGEVTLSAVLVEQEISLSCDLDISLPSKMDISQGQEDMEGLDDEAPLKNSNKTKSSLKKQWNTRSRKRRTPLQHHHFSQYQQDEAHSVDSTDTEDDIVSQPSTCSPAHSQSDMDLESVQAHKQWKKAIIIVWRHAAQHKYANLFLHPVREEDAPGYRNVVLRPMDLSTIKKKIDSGLIKTDLEFQRDMLLMFQNAFMYNSSEHEVYFMAQEMKNDIMENIQAYLATQAQLQLMEDNMPSKMLRSREGTSIHSHLYGEAGCPSNVSDSSAPGRFREGYEEVFSPTKKRRTRADD